MVFFGTFSASDGVFLVCAWVVPTQDDPQGVAERVRARAADKLAAYKRPREVRIVSALPRTANGKLIRRNLRRDPGGHPG